VRGHVLVTTLELVKLKALTAVYFLPGSTEGGETVIEQVWLDAAR
jgi:hypothetical protein